MIKLALIGAIIGLVVLFFLTEKIPERISIDRAYDKNIDDWVLISGKINWTKNYDGFTLFNVCENKDCINVIVYDKINVSKFSDYVENVEILGKIKIYKGKKEIQAEIIKSIA